ncbi:hypothetical protein CL6EHI_148260 [Entamoeba histolytica]|nr:hypothetical protein CL6EHI_148260 [Entamoeba histolytica]
MSRSNQDMYWCQFCKKFIQNKDVTRQQHESSFSHKSNMQKYLENEKRKESKQQQQELNTLNLIKSMEENAIKQVEQDISHNAIRETVIQKDEKLREDLKEIKQKRKEAQEEEKASRSYLFIYENGKLKNPMKTQVQSKNQETQVLEKELSNEGNEGDWYFSDNKDLPFDSNEWEFI